MGLIINVLILFLNLYCISAQLRHYKSNSTSSPSEYNILTNATKKSLKLSVISTNTGSHFDNWGRSSGKPTVEVDIVKDRSWPDTGYKVPRERPHHKHHGGKRVCPQHKTIHVPYKATEVYTKPTIKHYTEPCNGQQICTGVRLVREPVYRDVIRHRPTKQVTYTCCPGWEQVTKNSYGCNKAICQYPCKNGGTCIKPDTCSCTKGFTGKFCEKDINECKEIKPCDQNCFNTEGSYYCTCREGFTLHTDMESCKKNVVHDHELDIEARDFSNDINFEELNSRLINIERTMNDEKNLITNQFNNKISNTMESVNSLRMRIDSIEHRQHQMNEINEKIKAYDLQSRKVEHIIDLLYKCRTQSSIYCP